MANWKTDKEDESRQLLDDSEDFFGVQYIQSTPRSSTKESSVEDVKVVEAEAHRPRRRGKPAVDSGGEFIDEQFFSALKSHEESQSCDGADEQVGADSSDSPETLSGSKERERSSSVFEEQYFSQLSSSARPMRKSDSISTDESHLEVTAPSASRSSAISGSADRRKQPDSGYPERTISRHPDKLQYDAKSGRYFGASEYVEPDEATDDVEQRKDLDDPDEFDEFTAKHLEKLRQLSARPPKEPTRRRPERAIDLLDKLEKEHETNQLRELQAKDVDGSLASLHAITSLIDPVWKMTPNELTQMMLKRVLYNDHDLVAFDKPYGMCYAGGPKDQAQLDRILPSLQKVVAPQSERLYVVKPLEKHVTGPVLFAKNKLLQSELLGMYREGRVTQVYNCITKSVPDPREGRIAIPLSIYMKNGDIKMKPSTGPAAALQAAAESQGSKGKRSESRHHCMVNTDYRVVRDGKMCALVECRVANDVTHQVRSHLGFGIDCPILGDAKYTHLFKRLPQRLPPPVLQMLGIRGAKSRELPMFLHLRRVIEFIVL
uniref:Pseudouridylate synthase RPUSD4, mitochondrial n=1 Tax=Plectus sambesii TaxID=2011161 RepID=A0A914XJQ9_9BILA